MVSNKPLLLELAELRPLLLSFLDCVTPTEIPMASKAVKKRTPKTTSFVMLISVAVAVVELETNLKTGFWCS